MSSCLFIVNSCYSYHLTWVLLLIRWNMFGYILIHLFFGNGNVGRVGRQGRRKRGNAAVGGWLGWRRRQWWLFSAAEEGVGEQYNREEMTNQSLSLHQWFSFLFCAPWPCIVKNFCFLVYVWTPKLLEVVWLFLNFLDFRNLPFEVHLIHNSYLLWLVYLLE